MSACVEQAASRDPRWPHFPLPCYAPPVSEAAAGEALFEAAFRDSAAGIALVSLDGSWLCVNDAFCGLLGYAREQLLALDYAAITHADDRAADQAQNHELVEGQRKSFHVEKRYLHAAGHPIWVEATVSLAFDATQKPAFLTVLAQDMTAHRMVETEARTFFENSLDLLAIADTQGRFLRVNPAWEHVLGYSAEELTSRPFLEFVHEEDHARTLGAIEALVLGKQVRSFRNRYRAKDGTLRWLDWNTQPEEGGRLFCVARDVTDQVEHDELRARLEEEIRQAALVDPLTGSYNRRGFFLLAEQALRAAVRHQRNYVLCFFDLNGLKEINDELGHDQGDDALYDIAEVFRQVFRSSDIIARMGGDEFVVLAEGEPSAEAALRQRVGDEIARHNEIGGRAYRLATSMGVTSFDPRKPSTLSELLQRADRQMYEHKRITRRSSVPETSESEAPSQIQIELPSQPQVEIKT
jgi:diguanylate cyclase (GGDEF)-like protein/PAS domain S-box-containing protein